MLCIGVILSVPDIYPYNRSGLIHVPPHCAIVNTTTRLGSGNVYHVSTAAVHMSRSTDPTFRLAETANSFIIISILVKWVY